MRSCWNLVGCWILTSSYEMRHDVITWFFIIFSFFAPLTYKLLSEYGIIQIIFLFMPHWANCFEYPTNLKLSWEIWNFCCRNSSAFVHKCNLALFDAALLSSSTTASPTIKSIYNRDVHTHIVHLNFDAARLFSLKNPTTHSVRLWKPLWNNDLEFQFPGNQVASIVCYYMAQDETAWRKLFYQNPFTLTLNT